jgi:hypothetical protein
MTLIIASVRGSRSIRYIRGTPRYPVMPSDEKTQPLVCSHCQQTVELGTARTDEDGKAIHPECYLLRLRMKRGTTSPRE